MSENGQSGFLRRRWWVVAVVAAATVAAAALFTARTPSVYRATTTLVVVPNSEITDPSDVLRSLDTLERRTLIATFARIPGTPETRDRAALRLGIEAKELRAFRAWGSVLPNTNIVSIDVEGPDAKRVADLANAVAAVTRREARSLYRIFTLKTMAVATPPGRPILPDPQRNHVVAAILGLFLGTLVAFAADRVARRS